MQTDHYDRRRRKTQVSYRNVARSTYGRVVGRLPLSARRRVIYTTVHFRPPNLSAPRSFTEKINWRIVNDQRPLLAWTCDKSKMKQKVAERSPDVYIPETIWRGRNVSELERVRLPHGGYSNPIIRPVASISAREKKPLSTGSVSSRADGWTITTSREYSASGRTSRPDETLLVEEWLGDGSATPTDYKFFVFDGRPQYVMVQRDRFEDRAENFYTADWSPVDANGRGWPRGSPSGAPPSSRRCSG